MDYEFYFDTSEQRAIARVQPPQEALGTWLSYELGVNLEMALNVLEQLSSNQPEWQVEGREWLLYKEEDAIWLKHHSLYDPDVEQDELHIDSTALSAETGSEDFEHLLRSWLSYVNVI